MDISSSASPAPAQSTPAPLVAVILPAYNEATRIEGVLRAVAQAKGVDEIIVVTDGCSDNTAEVARSFAAQLGEDQPPLRVFEMQHNIGKGGALTYGVHRTNAEVLLFLDADLNGLQPSQVEAMLEPMCRANPAERTDMVLGLFSSGPGAGRNVWVKTFDWCISFSHRTAAYLTGQRAIRRDVFLAVPDLTRSRFGVETAITRYVCRVWKLPVAHVYLAGLTHPIQEQKAGVWKGLWHRLNMYSEIVAYVALDTARNFARARYSRHSQRVRQWLSGDKL